MIKLNDNETEYLVIDSRHTTSQVSDAMKSIETEEKKLPLLHLLGISVLSWDSTLSMEDQVASICKAYYLGIRGISIFYNQEIFNRSYCSFNHDVRDIQIRLLQLGVCDITGTTIYCGAKKRNSRIAIYRRNFFCVFNKFHKI